MLRRTTISWVHFHRRFFSTLRYALAAALAAIALLHSKPLLAQAPYVSELHSFNASAGGWIGKLDRGIDGNLFGTTAQDVALFKIVNDQVQTICYLPQYLL